MRSRSASASGSKRPLAGPRPSPACARCAIAGCPRSIGNSPSLWPPTISSDCPNCSPSLRRDPAPGSPTQRRIRDTGTHRRPGPHSRAIAVVYPPGKSKKRRNPPFFSSLLVVGYLLAVVGPQWHLTYGQSAVILYSGGIGAIVGALVFGRLSDAWGRKITMIIGTLICAVSSGLMGIVPSGAWEVFAVLRFFIGVGLTAGVTPSLAIQVELTPTRHRTLLTDR